LKRHVVTADSGQTSRSGVRHVVAYNETAVDRVQDSADLSTERPPGQHQNHGEEPRQRTTRKFAVRLLRTRYESSSEWTFARSSAVVPRQVDLEPAPHSQACNTACGPRGGQCGREADLCLVAQQQHLIDCRRAAEVAVDLKRGGCASNMLGYVRSGPSRNVSMS
jgi:hypothetical protein